MTDDRIIGRDREARQLELAIGPGGDGLRLAMLSGPSGLGKTTLASVAVEQAAGRGFRTAVVDGRAGVLSTPFAPFIEAMPEFDALLAVLAGDQAVDVEHAGVGLVNLLAELTSDTPLLLVFDDAQALDESSIALLPYVVGVSERMDLSIMFVEQTDAVGVPSSYRAFIDGLLARRVVNHLELGPMSPESIGELVRHELALDEEAEVPGELVERAAGNPWFAKELSAAWRAGTSEIPTTIAAAATARLHGLDEDAQDLVSAIALCDAGAHIGWLEQLSGQKPRRFVRTMEAIESSGLVREDKEVLTVAHPLMQQALLDELSTAMRRAIHIELAEAIGDVPLPEVVAARGQGYHLSRAGRSDEAVAHYLRAAEANEVEGQLHEAYSDVLHARDAEPRMEGRAELLKRCAALSMQLGTNEAIEHWTELGRLAASNGDDELYAYALFQQYWACNDGTANDRLQRAASLGAEQHGWSARAAATIARMDGDYERAIELDRRCIEIARDKEDAALEALALQKLAASLADSGEADEAVTTYRDAVDRSVSLRLHDWALHSWGELVETLHEVLRTGDAVPEIDAAIRYAEDLGLDRMRPALLTWKASALLRAGDVEASSDCIEQAAMLDANFRDDARYRNDHWTTLIRLLRAEVAIDLGRPEAMQRVEDAEAFAREVGHASWELLIGFERLRAVARKSGLDAALKLLPDVDVTTEPVVAGSIASWLARAALLESSADAMSQAQAIADALPERPGSIIELLHAEVGASADVLEGGDIAALQLIADRWTDAGRVLDALRVQAGIGAVLLARGSSAEARPVLDAVKKGLSDCGASGDVDRVAALLRQTGARSRAKSRESNVGSLTKRELEIARHVATGMKNSEVAEALFLAEKTVAAHLSNIYGKLEVRSRVQLTAWLRENDPELDSITAAG